MEEEMEFKKAPRANLQTWAGMNTLIIWSTAGIVIVLLLLAAIFV
ncbi:MAG: hypothetical protein QNJ84_09520 [Alphaproteobacteria bacterium]|nr:hypothetical protein [Alphaproteobacteria bacterium]